MQESEFEWDSDLCMWHDGTNTGTVCCLKTSENTVVRTMHDDPNTFAAFGFELHESLDVTKKLDGHETWHIGQKKMPNVKQRKNLEVA